MDEPDLPPAALEQALSGIGRLNRASGVDRALFARLARSARSAGGPLRVLDVACGGGDVTLSLVDRARRAGLALEVDGCDVSGTAVRFAAENAARRGLPARFFELDCIEDELPSDYDAIVCTLFLHHLGRGEILKLFASAIRSGARLVLASDLVRSRAGYWLAILATRLLTRSEVVHADGPRSVERAFSVEEMRGVVRDAGLAGATVRRAWPFRMLVEWERP